MPNKILDSVLTTLDARQQATVQGLIEFLKIPSVSTKPDHAPAMRQCADWLAGKLRDAGFAATVEPTAGHPVVLARNQHQPGRPTVLLYGHYDVQPPEPLELWTTPPFEPAVRTTEAGTQAVFARGAVDDKGQVWAHVEALAAWQAAGGVPVNVTLLIEGEEEIGSPHLADFIKSHADQLRADVALISDTNQFARGLPAITYGLRGLAYAEITVTGPDHDLHSGLYGGAVPNPANILCQLIASLHDANGRVNLPGFYNDVIELTPAERETWRKLPSTDAEFTTALGLPAGADGAGSGEVGYSALERTWAQPSCDVNGLTAGYQGPGAKTVIASQASAKVSMRLVPAQDPAKIQAAFEQVVRDRLPRNVTHRIQWFGVSAPVLVPMDSKPTQLAARALQIGFRTAPTFMRGGGSIPVVGIIQSLLKVETLLIGFGLPDDRVHSPNEKFDLDALHGGTRTAAALYALLAEL